MMTAPIRPIRAVKDPEGTDGTKPAKTSTTGGLIINILSMKAKAMVATKHMKKASSFLTPHICSKRKVKVSKMVRMAPSQMGRPKIILRAMAVPITS